VVKSLFKPNVLNRKYKNGKHLGVFISAEADEYLRLYALAHLDSIQTVASRVLEKWVREAQQTNSKDSLIKLIVDKLVTGWESVLANDPKESLSFYTLQITDWLRRRHLPEKNIQEILAAFKKEVSHEGGKD
jgi:hypothetical protein